MWSLPIFYQVIRYSSIFWVTSIFCCRQKSHKVYKKQKSSWDLILFFINFRISHSVFDTIIIYLLQRIKFTINSYCLFVTLCDLLQTLKKLLKIIPLFSLTSWIVHSKIGKSFFMYKFLPPDCTCFNTK